MENNHLVPNQQTRVFEPVLFQCWASVVDGGPPLKQYWFHVVVFSCLV